MFPTFCLRIVQYVFTVFFTTCSLFFHQFFTFGEMAKTTKTTETAQQQATTSSTKQQHETTSNGNCVLLALRCVKSCFQSRLENNTSPGGVSPFWANCSHRHTNTLGPNPSSARKIPAHLRSPVPGIIKIREMF